jgi:dihydrofolate reductase/thymidylate synthase
MQGAASSEMRFDVVVAACRRTLGIGCAGALPWRIPADMRYFKQLTVSTRDPLRRNAVVMGRKTYESLPPKQRPLPDRLNVVLSRTPEAELRAALGLPVDVLVASSLDHALSLLGADASGGGDGGGSAAAAESVFVIGGAAVYAEALASSRLGRAYVTFVDLPDGAPLPAYDAALPAGCLDHLTTVRASKGPNGPDGASPEFAVLARDGAAAAALPAALVPVGTPYLGEAGYLQLVRAVLDGGARRGDRTGTGTRALFGAQLRFDLRRSFPLLTTKSVFWRGVAEELLWFVSGATDASLLQARGIKIWDGNSSRTFLDKLGLSAREEGDLGPVYGFQWRHFGAAYSDRHADYAGQGVDQLARAIELLRTNPEVRAADGGGRAGGRRGREAPRGALSRPLAPSLALANLSRTHARAHSVPVRAPRPPSTGLPPPIRSGPSHPRLCVEPKRPRQDGAPALSRPLPVLRRRRRAQLPDVPAQRGPGARRALQHRELRAPHQARRARHGLASGRARAHARRRARCGAPARDPGTSAAVQWDAASRVHRRSRAHARARTHAPAAAAALSAGRRAAAQCMRIMSMRCASSSRASRAPSRRSSSWTRRASPRSTSSGWSTSASTATSRTARSR